MGKFVKDQLVRWNGIKAKIIKLDIPARYLIQVNEGPDAFRAVAYESELMALEEDSANTNKSNE